MRTQPGLKCAGTRAAPRGPRRKAQGAGLRIGGRRARTGFALHGGGCPCASLGAARTVKLRRPAAIKLTRSVPRAAAPRGAERPGRGFRGEHISGRCVIAATRPVTEARATARPREPEADACDQKERSGPAPTGERAPAASHSPAPSSPWVAWPAPATRLTAPGNTAQSETRFKLAQARFKLA